MEGQKRSAHQCKRTGGSHKYSAIISQREGTCPPKNGQSSHLCLFGQGWGKDPQPKQASQTIFKMVHVKRYNVDRATGQKFRGFSRWSQQMVPGQGGLYNGQKPIPLLVAKNEKSKDKSTGGHVCLHWQLSTPKICFKIPPLAMGN